MNINPCPMCGSPAELNSTAAAECYGHAWQTLSVECTDVTGQYCGMSLDLSADFSDINSFQDELIETWNKISKSKGRS